MPKACLTTRVAALAVVCAVGASVAIAAATAGNDMQATATLSGVPERTASTATTVSGPTNGVYAVRVPAHAAAILTVAAARD